MSGNVRHPYPNCKIQNAWALRSLASPISKTLVEHLSKSVFRLLPLLSLIFTSCSTLAPLQADMPAPETLLRIEDKRLDEISGMACSLREPGVLWVHNDSGDKPRLFAIGPDGETRGVLEITNATARDWEDMALVNIDGKPWILIADVGDNDAVRNDVVIYLLPEPDPRDFANQPTLRVTAPSVMPFRYEDGPRDCEGVAIDPSNGQIFLISKRTEPPVLYSLPLMTESDNDNGSYVAKRIHPLVGIVAPTPAEKMIPGRLGAFRSQVTAFDISGDNHSAAVLTYGNIYLYDRAVGERWSDALTREPKRIPVKGLRQTESLCFNENGATLLLSTEAKQPPVIRYRLR